MASPTTMEKLLPLDLLVAVSDLFPRCECDTDDRLLAAPALGCTGSHAPGAFCAENPLSQLRQTSRAWRAVALRRGVSQVVGSGRWARRAGRLDHMRASYGVQVQRLVFRAADFFRDGCSDSGVILDALEAFLALGWPRVDAVAVEWFSGSQDDHRRIASAVRRHAPRARELFVRDKAAALAPFASMLWSADNGSQHQVALRRLAVTPYGYNQRWEDLRPASDAAAAAAVARMPGQLSALAVGGSDFSPALMHAIQQAHPRMASLAVSHAWLGALTASAVVNITSLHLEHVMAEDSDLPLSATMFPRLRSLTVRHVWQPADRPRTARGAVSLQNADWLSGFCAQRWPHLRSLALPAVADADAAGLLHACLQLTRLTTHSLDYAGPRLTAVGLAHLLRMPSLRHLTIEQRRADGTPGYDVLDTALVRLLTPGPAPDQMAVPTVPLRRSSTSSTITMDLDTETYTASALASTPAPASAAVDFGALGSDTEVEVDAYADASATADFAMMDLHVPIEASGHINSGSRLVSLVIPGVSFSSANLDAMLRLLPNLVRLSVSLRNEKEPASFFKSRKTAALAEYPRAASSSLKCIALTADEDILTDPLWLAAWLTHSFPALRECRTNHSRMHRRLVASLRTQLPAVSFARLSSRALQATSN
ncbi:hypothetical protein FB645_005943 [Coemansia sp. IMI 203386]|nr:hypothetical protein FB645_005943 [Coemansia sp. IMI 203386]